VASGATLHLRVRTLVVVQSDQRLQPPRRRLGLIGNVGYLHHGGVRSCCISPAAPLKHGGWPPRISRGCTVKCGGKRGQP
jgi:hypothetical protein